MSAVLKESLEWRSMFVNRYRNPFSRIQIEGRIVLAYGETFLFSGAQTHVGHHAMVTVHMMSFTYIKIQVGPATEPAQDPRAR
jgi:hypothetical protein